MQFIALTSIGIENLLHDELSQLGAQVGKQTVGSIRFEADSTTAQKICLASRFATRIMLLLEQKTAINSKDDLYKMANFQPWQDYFGPTQSFAVEFNGTNRLLKNSQFAGLVVKDAIVDYFNDLYEQRPNVDKLNPNVRVVAKLNRDNLALYIDYSGPRLSQRGYREAQGKAPIKEHLAAALVARSGWLNDTSRPLFDPCCGSGTLLIEAAHMAMNKPANIEREQFAFERLPSFRRSKFDELKAELKSEQKNQQTPAKLWLIGQDIDERVLTKAKQNAQRANVSEYISFEQSDLNQLSLPAKRAGVVLANLPFGERLGGMAELTQLYRNLGLKLKQHFKDWQVALLASDESLLKLLKLIRTKQYKFKNGPLDTVLALYQLDEKQVQSSNINATALHFEHSSAFANRIKKNLQGLKKWRKAEQIEAYRVYDADIPEYNVAVDVYGDNEQHASNKSAVIYEYAPPKQIDADTAHKRLQDVISLTAQQLDIDPLNIAVKVRKRQKGDSQYQAQAQQNRTQIVHEYGAQFIVNLFDYLDTGLFLDHRLARKLIRQLSPNKRVLNLFAYTGTASVQAALGGAKSVTTVDMSNTYLKWAQQNFAQNQLKSPRYRFEQADCLHWLSQAQGQYDVIFLDPPTFSNSKKMKTSFDVERDHLQLMTWVKRILAPNGVLIFSNNKRGFTLDHQGLAELGLSAQNITEQSLSPDFARNKKIHNCWRITHG